MAYTVFRSDNMPGIDNRAYITSVLVQDEDGNPIEVENGTIVKVGAKVEGKHDLYAATLAAGSDAKDKTKLAVIGTPELIYDESKHYNLDEFINQAGVPAAAYMLGYGGDFSITKEGFVGDSLPGLGHGVGIVNGKIDAFTPGLGTLLAIEKVGRYTYYTIRL